MRTLVMLTVVLALAANGWATMVVTENFDTDPGWTEKSNRIGDGIGYHPKRSSYGLNGEGPDYLHAGEIGGLMNRSHPAYGNSYYADDGLVLTLDDAWSASGEFTHTLAFRNGNPDAGADGLVHFGYANQAALDAGTSAEWYYDAITFSVAGHNRIGMVIMGTWVQLGGWILDGDPLTTPYGDGNKCQWQLLYDPAAGNGTVTAHWLDTISGNYFSDSYELTPAQRASGLTLTLFGIGCRISGGDDQRTQAYFDNFSYTIPEPASLCLLAVGGLALRRRK